VSYFAPNLGGFYGQASVAAGEGVVGKKFVGGRIGFRAGPLDVSGSAGQTLVAANAAGDDKYKMYDLGAAYDLGIVKLTGYYSQMKYANLKLAVANIGALVPLGQGKVRVSYVNANASGITAAGASTDADDASQFAVGYVYDLSKRTALYGTVARVNNKGNAAFAVASSPALPAGRDSTGYEIGLRHSF
jgi:predicted porin